MLQPELVRRVEKDLLNIMAGGTAENMDILGHLTSLLLLQKKKKGKKQRITERVKNKYHHKSGLLFDPCSSLSSSSTL